MSDTPNTDSKDLVPLPHPRSLETFEVQGELDEEHRECFASVAEVSPKAPEFLEHFYRTGNVALASVKAGISESTHRQWKRRSPAFAEALDEVEENINQRWDAVSDFHAKHGFEERIYDKHGQLAGMKVRQDAGFFRAFMASRRENWRSRASDTQDIQVNVIVRNE